MTDRVAAETYLVLVPDIWTYAGSTRVRGIRVDRIRSGKPALNRGEIAVHLKLNFEKADLIDAIPVVEIEVKTFKAGDPLIEVV